MTEWIFLMRILVFVIIGSIIGVATHLFNGIVQSDVSVNKHFLQTLTHNYFKIILVLMLSVCTVGVLIAIFPFHNIGVDAATLDILHQVVFYLYAFGAYDFTQTHVVKNIKKTKII
jgi:hypothetical protein